MQYPSTTVQTERCGVSSVFHLSSTCSSGITHSHSMHHASMKQHYSLICMPKPSFKKQKVRRKHSPAGTGPEAGLIRSSPRNVARPAADDLRSVCCETISDIHRTSYSSTEYNDLLSHQIHLCLGWDIAERVQCGIVHGLIHLELWL